MDVHEALLSLKFTLLYVTVFRSLKFEIETVVLTFSISWDAFYK